MAKLGSFAMALRKYCRESSRRRFSARFLPLTKSARAASDVVVIAILPAA